MTTQKRILGRPGQPSRFGPEFQRDAVAMVLDEGRSGCDVARALGINDGTELGFEGTGAPDGRRGSQY